MDSGVFFIYLDKSISLVDEIVIDRCKKNLICVTKLNINAIVTEKECIETVSLERWKSWRSKLFKADLKKQFRIQTTKNKYFRCNHSPKRPKHKHISHAKPQSKTRSTR